MAKFPHAAALGSLGAFAIERGRSLGNDLGIYRCRHVVTPFLISCLELFLFLFFSTSLRQIRQRTIHISSRESERDLPHCHLSIYPPTYLSIIMSNKELLREYTDPAIYNSHHERFERLGLPHTQEEWIQRAAGMSFHSFRC